MARPDFITDEHLEFLDGLREEGIVNMFGARPYIADTFGLDITASKEILSYWMKTFGNVTR